MPLGANKAALFGVAGVSTADVVLLSTQTASDSASLDFTSGITSTYGEYIFKFYNINPATDTATFGFQCNATDSTSYDETITSSFFRAFHHEVGYSPGLLYNGLFDQAQGTGLQALSEEQGGDADEHCAGTLHLFNPSSTTYVKHFIGRMTVIHYHPVAVDAFMGGYINTTTAIDDIKFYMSSGNFDGTIKMWGVKK